GNWIFAYLEDKPIGMMGDTWFADIPDDGRYLEYLWIAPAWRRSGVASAFITKVIEDLKTRGVGSIWLWVLDGNDPAMNLYEKLGFEVHGKPVDLKGYPGRSETRMKKLDLSDLSAG